MTVDKSKMTQGKGFIGRMRAAPRYVSVPVGLLLIIGGVFSFLPVLGVWMLPIGLAILAPSFPFANRLTRRMLRWSIRRGLLGNRRNGDQDRSPPGRG